MGSDANFGYDDHRLFLMQERQMAIEAAQEVVLRLGFLAITSLLYLNGFGLALSLLAGTFQDMAVMLSVFWFLGGLTFAMVTLAVSYILAQMSLASPAFMAKTSVVTFLVYMVLPPSISFAAFVTGCLMWRGV